MPGGAASDEGLLHRRGSSLKSWRLQLRYGGLRSRKMGPLGLEPVFAFDATASVAGHCVVQRRPRRTGAAFSARCLARFAVANVVPKCLHFQSDSRRVKCSRSRLSSNDFRLSATNPTWRGWNF